MNLDPQSIVLCHYACPSEIDRYRKRVAEGLRNWEREILRRYRPSGPILNVGCGGGRESFALHDSGYAVTGVDISEAEVESARQSATGLGKGVSFLSYDGIRLPFGDGGFGGITLWSQVLGNVPGSSNRQGLLTECHRVLAREGMLSLSVHERASTVERLQAGNYTVELLDNVLDEGDLIVSEPGKSPCYWHWFTRDELHRLCTDSRFSRVEVLTTGELGEAWNNVLVATCWKAT